MRIELAPATRRVLTTGLVTHLRPASRPLDANRWTGLRQESQAHALNGLLVAAVADGSLPVTDEQAADAAQLEVELTGARMQAEGNVAEVTGWLTDAGIDVRLLKGLALATLDYPDPQMRPTGDVDLLVRGRQLDAAVKELVDRGGVLMEPDPVPGYGAVVGKGAPVRMSSPPTEVDLHRLLVWGPLGVRMPPSDLWGAGRELVVGDRPVRTLGREETLLHTAYHLLIGGTPRALSVRDVAQLMTSPALDAERAVRLAETWGAAAVLATAVATAADQLDLVDPGPVHRWAAGYRIGRRDALWLRTHGPDRGLVGLEPLATYLELRSAEERRLLRAATLHPEPGTWPGPRQRVTSVLRRVTRRP